MPSLPRSPFGRRGRVAAEIAPERTEPRVEIVEAPGLRWINIERPRGLEQAWLEERFEFHALDYEDVRSRNQRPKVDEYDDYLFIVLHFPRYDKVVSRLNAAEVDIFVGPDYLITIPNEPLQSIDYLFERCRANEELRESLFSKGPGYLLYKIVDDCVDASFPMLGKIGNKLERIEEEIFEGEGDEIVRDISNAKQEIINFRKIVRPQRLAFRDLERNKARYIAEDLDIYFDDIIDASERAWDMLENYKEVVEGLESTNESAIAHRTNETFRVLTAISLIFLPLTLIASVFGMNVHASVPGRGARVLGDHHRDARDRDRRGGVLPQARMAVSLPEGVEALADADRPKRMLVIINPVATKMSEKLQEPRRLRAPGPLRGHDARDRGQGPRDRALPRGGGAGLRRRRGLRR